MKLVKSFEACGINYEKQYNSAEKLKPNVRFCSYDFHAKHSEESIEDLFKKFKGILDYFRFFRIGSNPREQLGVVRTNCLDCLDRTNVIQTKLAWKILKNQFAELGIYTEMYFQDDMHPVFSKFKKLWLKNGHKISLQYTGTEAITKGGVGILGPIKNGIKSINRFINANLTDDFKQICIRLLLGDPASKVQLKI